MHPADPFSFNYCADSSNDSGVMIHAAVMGRSITSARFLCSSDCGAEVALLYVLSRIQTAICEEGTVSESVALVILGGTYKYTNSSAEIAEIKIF